MIRNGKGGGNTKTGLIFEGKTDLETFLSKQKGYNVKAEQETVLFKGENQKIIVRNVYYNSDKVAELYKKNEFYAVLLKKLNKAINVRKVVVICKIFINDFLYNIGFCGDVDDSVIDTLEYLSGKYELVVLTNWFTEAQSNRLRSAGIDKYFSKVYGGNLILKPEKHAFINAAGNSKLEECIMIGDSYNLDVMGAYNAGIKPIFMNPKHKENKNNFDEIEKLSDLKDIL